MTLKTVLLKPKQNAVNNADEIFIHFSTQRCFIFWLKSHWNVSVSFRIIQQIFIMASLWGSAFGITNLFWFPSKWASNAERCFSSFIISLNKLPSCPLIRRDELFIRSPECHCGVHFSRCFATPKYHPPPRERTNSSPIQSIHYHYSDVIMGMMAYQITSLASVYSIVYSDADQRKHQSSASLAFVRDIHQWPGNAPHKGPVTRKCFNLMTSSCSLFTFRHFSPVTGGFPSQRPVTRSFDIFLICVWTNDWASTRDAGDLWRHSAHYDITVMVNIFYGIHHVIDLLRW